MTPDEVIDMIEQAIVLSGRRSVEDDVMRKMSVLASSVAIGINSTQPDPDNRRLALMSFMLGYMACEDEWAAMEVWR